MFEFVSTPLAKGLISALISYSAHYVTTKAYSTACVPDGIYGFLQGLVISGSPVCQVGIQVMTATQVSYSTVIMMGISRLILDTVAPSSDGAKTPSSDMAKADPSNIKNKA